MINIRICPCWRSNDLLNSPSRSTQKGEAIRSPSASAVSEMDRCSTVINLISERAEVPDLTVQFHVCVLKWWTSCMGPHGKISSKLKRNKDLPRNPRSVPTISIRGAESVPLGVHLYSYCSCEVIVIQILPCSRCTHMLMMLLFISSKPLNLYYN